MALARGPFVLSPKCPPPPAFGSCLSIPTISFLTAAETTYFRPVIPLGEHLVIYQVSSHVF